MAAITTETPPPKPPDPPKNGKSDFPTMATKSKKQDMCMNNMLRQPQFMKYLEIDFGTTDRGQVNPYQIMNEIEATNGGKGLEFEMGGTNILS